jgi:exosortase B
VELKATSLPHPGRQADRVALGLAAACLLLLAVPTVLRLNVKVWSTIEQSYGPVLLAASIWLFWERRKAILALESAPAPITGFSLLTFSFLLYVVGQSQDVMMFAAGAVFLTFVALLLLSKGWRAVRVFALPLVVLAFVIPLPVEIVAAMTAPLKSAVSAVAESILNFAGYPVARTGVVLMVGQYQMLVADACAGLTSMFTLEAIGLVYMGLRRHPSRARNVTLGLLLVPIALVSNVIRVLVLVLVTYHFGDEAGQGFVHQAAGILLFMVAVSLMLVVDLLLDMYPWSPNAAETRV